ncbi:hypothetical protein [Rubritalea tangerina]
MHVVPHLVLQDHSFKNNIRTMELRWQVRKTFNLGIYNCTG